MSRAKTQNPVKPGRKRVATPAVLTPIDEADVDAAFAGIRLESEPADDDVPVEIESGADFDPDLAELAEVKKADSPTRRAQTKPAEIEEPAPPAKKGPPKPPPGAKPGIPSILTKVKATATATAETPTVKPAAPPTSAPLIAPATGGVALGRISVPSKVPAKVPPPPSKVPPSKAPAKEAGPDVGSNATASIPDAPPTIVSPNPLEAPPTVVRPSPMEVAAPVKRAPPPPPARREPPVLNPRADSVLDLADSQDEHAAYVPPKRAKRAESEIVDEDAKTMAPAPRAESYLEYALRSGLPRPETLGPPARDSEMKIEPVPTKVLEAALRFDSEPSIEAPIEPPAEPVAPERKSEFDIQPVPTKVLDAALRMESEPKAEPAPPARLAIPKLALRDDSNFDYSTLALDADASGRMVVEPPRANSALEHALRESVQSIDLDLPVGEESGDFGDIAEPVRRMQPSAEREPSVSDGQAFEVDVAPETPMLQLAVYETHANLAAAAEAIGEAGHTLAVGASDREGLEKIGIAMADGHLDAILVGLPGGEVLIKAALSLAPWGPVVIAACANAAPESVRAANAAGADLVTIRPHGVERLAPILLAAARILEQRRDMMAAAQGREEDLLTRLESADGESEAGGLLPFEGFRRALELELKRVRRYQYALTLALFSLEITSTQPPPPGIKGILRARAGNALIHSIRDIDMATELDQDRFLVLLPYTDLAGATMVARRIIGAVGAIAPVVAAGAQFQPRLVGAIAGTKPGQQQSFNKLIRDAQRALDEARRDGAELAVQP